MTKPRTMFPRWALVGGLALVGPVSAAAGPDGLLPNRRWLRRRRGFGCTLTTRTWSGEGTPKSSRCQVTPESVVFIRLPVPP